MRDVASALDFLHTKGEPSLCFGWAGWANPPLGTKVEDTVLAGNLSKRWYGWQAPHGSNLSRTGEEVYDSKASLWKVGGDGVARQRYRQKTALTVPKARVGSALWFYAGDGSLLF